MTRYRRHAPHGRHRGGDVGDPPPPRPELAVGCLLGDKYLLSERVGIGGMGEVWAAEHVTLHMKVAVKVLLPRALDVPEIVARFKREALLLARTRSEFVPRAVDFTVDDMYGPILVTDLVEGECLSNAMKAPLSVEETVDIGIALASGLADLHRSHVVHRDLKPSNVILTRSAGGERRAMILDLGVSRWVNDEPSIDEESEISAITIGDNVVGTLEYMPPEQLLHCGGVTSTADVYALGAILARAVLGRHIFGALEKVELVKTKLTADAPALETGRTDRTAVGLVEIVRRALQRDTGDRYRSADELLEALQGLRAGPAATCPTGTGSITDAAPDRETLAAPEPAQPEPIRPSTPPKGARAAYVTRPLRSRVVTALMLLLLVLGIAVCSREPKVTSAAPSGAAMTAPGER